MPELAFAGDSANSAGVCFAAHILEGFVEALRATASPTRSESTRKGAGSSFCGKEIGRPLRATALGGTAKGRCHAGAACRPGPRLLRCWCLARCTPSPPLPPQPTPTPAPSPGATGSSLPRRRAPVLACLSRPPESKRSSRGLSAVEGSDFCLTVLAPSSASRRHSLPVWPSLASRHSDPSYR